MEVSKEKLITPTSGRASKKTIISFGIEDGYEPIDGSAAHPTKKRRWCLYGSLLITIAIVVGVVVTATTPDTANSLTPIVKSDPGLLRSVGVSAAAGASCSLSSSTVTVSTSDGNRKVELYVPSSVKSNTVLMLVWHGIGSSPSKIEDKMQFKKKADEEGWILAYPNGVGFPANFNGAGCCARQSVGFAKDDVGFAKDIIKYLTVTHTCANPSNVFTTGFSNGGFMTHRLGCQAGLRGPNDGGVEGESWIKAIAAHSGLIGKSGDQDSTCSPGYKVPVLSFHGDGDDVVGIDGSGTLGMSWRSFEDTMQLWVKNNGCSSADLDETDQRSSTTLCKRYKACDVEYCTISGLGHNWSGEPSLAGSRPADVDATSMIVEFFKGHVTN